MNKDEIKEMNFSEMLFNRDERLLDYITNLQEEVNKLTAESTEWESRYYDMQDNFHNANEEIERLNKECDTYMKIATKKDNIINKAIEELKSYIFDCNYSKENEIYEYIISILKGEENENK